MKAPIAQWERAIKRLRPSRRHASPLLRLPPHLPPPPPAILLPEPIVKIIGQLRKITRKAALEDGFLLLLGVLLVLLPVQMLVDFLLDLPRGVRLFLLLADAAIIGWLFWRRIFRVFAHPLKEDVAALQMEKKWPFLQGRVIASVQLARSHPLLVRGSETMVRALLLQTASQVSRLDVREIVSTAPVLRRLKKVGLIALGVAIAGFFSWPKPVPLLQRVFLSNVPVPHKTIVTDLTGANVVIMSDDLTLTARADGIVPSYGRLTIQSGNRTQEFTVRSAPDNVHLFHQPMRSITESFTYEIRLGDGTTGKRRIEVMPRPSLTDIKFYVTPPAYTKKPSGERNSGELAALPGSEIRVEATINQDIAGGELSLVGTDGTTPMKVNGRRLSGAFKVPAKDLSGFSIGLQLQSGAKSKIATVFKVPILPDKPPVLKILQPTEVSDYAIANDVIPLRIRATDDYGVEKITLHYRQTKPVETEPRQIVFDLKSPKDRTRLEVGLEWNLSQSEPVPINGVVLEYWVEAVDGNNVTGPGVGRSERRSLGIISIEEKRAALLGRLQETFQTLQRVRDLQQSSSTELGKFIRGNPTPPPTPD